MKKKIRNEKMWTRVYFLGAIIVLLMLFSLIFSVRSMNKISEEAVSYVGQTMKNVQTQDGESVDIEAVQKEIKSYASGTTRHFLIFGILFALAAVVFLVWLVLQMIAQMQSVEDMLKKLSEEEFQIDSEEDLQNGMEHLDGMAESIEILRRKISAQMITVKNETKDLEQELHSIHSGMDGMDSRVQEILEAAQRASSSIEAIDTSAEEMNRFSQDIQETAKNMALRVQQGAEQADDTLHVVPPKTR